ncbi:hypothetical protein, partial [Escherichia coli]|uniref:hypothetical protein n=1 Tax=Escherichia coli TaxID=562 RepID=UPI003BA1A525
CVLVMIAPLGTVRRALAGILLVTPPELQAHVDAVARAIVAKHGFVEHRSYVAQVGRGEQIELFFVVPENDPPRSVVNMMVSQRSGEASPSASPISSRSWSHSTSGRGG